VTDTQPVKRHPLSHWNGWRLATESSVNSNYTVRILSKMIALGAFSSEGPEVNCVITCTLYFPAASAGVTTSSSVLVTISVESTLVLLPVAWLIKYTPTVVLVPAIFILPPLILKFLLAVRVLLVVLLFTSIASLIGLYLLESWKGLLPIFIYFSKGKINVFFNLLLSRLY